MIPQGRHEDMEPPECDSDDVFVECDCCYNEAIEGDNLCKQCRMEQDELDENP